jgi:cation transport ATPase
MGFTCKRCGESFCAKHRLPENHECPLVDLRKEDLYLKIQLEKNQKQTTNQVQSPKKKLYRQTTTSRTMNFDDEDEAYDRSMYRQMPFTINLSTSFKIFVFLAIMDVVIFIFLPFLLMLLPMSVHAIFLPIIYIMVRKQKKAPYSPEMMANSLKIIILYMSIFMVLKVVVSVIIQDYFITIFLIGLGCVMLYSWIRMLQRVRHYL